MDKEKLLTELLEQVGNLEEKYELSKSMPEDYFEPGNMEYLDKYRGVYNKEKNLIGIKTNVKGLRYENRTLKLENMNIGDKINIRRENSNRYNYNNFSVFDRNGENLGNLPANLCNAIAPLYDAGYLSIEKSVVSFIEKIGERSRYAMQGILFIEIVMKIHTE